jgi:hypothetical protein
MKTKLFVCALSAALIAGIAGWSLAHGMHSVKAANGFSAASLKGTFGYTVQGQIGSTNPLAGTGLMVLDGNGGITGSETTQVYGVGLQNSQFQGSYTVNNDGSGVMVINYPAPAIDPNNPDAVPLPGVVAHYNFVIVGGTAEIKAVRGDNGTVATASFKLQ